MDVDSPAGFRAALRVVRERGDWGCPEGRAIVAAIPVHVVRVAALAGAPVTEAVSSAWMILAESSEAVITADRPWHYVAGSVRNALMGEAMAAALQTENASKARTVWRSSHVEAAPVRIGESGRWDLLEDRSLPARPAHRPVLQPRPVPSLADRPFTGLDPEEFGRFLGVVVRRLVEVGVPARDAAGMVSRATQIVAENKSNFRHWAARRDPVLTRRYGLTPVAAAALMNLLVGTRRAPQAGLLATEITGPGAPVSPAQSGWLRVVVAAHRAHRAHTTAGPAPTVGGSEQLSLAVGM